MSNQRSSACRWLVILGLCLCLSSVMSPALHGGLTSAAWADDHDSADDEDEDQDEDNDDGDAISEPSAGQSGPLRRLFGGAQPPRQQARPAQQRGAPVDPIILPDQAPAEIVVSELSDTDLALLLSEGFSVIETVTLGALNQDVTRLAPPADLDLEAARTRVRALPSGENADFNHYYRFERNETPELSAQPCTHENCPAWEMISWPRIALASGQCPINVQIGLIDTGINTEHEIMADAQVEVVRLADEAQDPSKAIHGTAVASLLVGDAKSRVPGLVSNATVIAADAFSRDGSDERADLISLLRGLDLLQARQVRVINLSLAGPDNRLLERALDTIVTENGIVVVAAAGNAGPNGKPAYPAAFNTVISVTAVDARARVYRQAQRGAHIDLTAPGVNMLTATSIRGARLKSGTSFAVPFVTAAVAILLSMDETLTPEEVVARLTEDARDLGAPGFDEIFGHGLLQAGDLC